NGNRCAALVGLNGSRENVARQEIGRRWKSLKNGSRRRSNNGEQLRCRNVEGFAGASAAHQDGFEGAEEERLVLNDWAAQRRAGLVPIEDGPLQPTRIVLEA